MQYLLSPTVVLRGWRDMPYAYYLRGSSSARPLTKEACRSLEKMYTPVSEEQFADRPELLAYFLRFALIEPYRGNDSVQEYQKYQSCECYYTPDVNWAITGRCNYTCLHCFNAKGQQQDFHEFSYEQAMAFVDELSACGVMNVTLTGGEPMLHPHFMEIVRYLNQKGLFLAEITTNGAYITQEILDEMSHFVRKPLFKISFDGIGWHDWLRNKEGAEQETLEKIKLLSQNGFRVQVQTNVHRKNMGSIQKTAEVMEALGVESMRVIRTSESPRWAENGKGLTLTLPEYYEFALDFIRNYTKKVWRMQTNIWQVVEMRAMQKQYRHVNIKSCGEDMGQMPVCTANKKRLAITPEGEAVPCNQMSGWMKKHKISFGNIYREPLREILGDSAYRKTVTFPAQEIIKRNPKVCGICSYNSICLGGCRVCAILQGKSEQTASLEGMEAYYNNYDAAKCLFFKTYKTQFDELFVEKGWKCENL